MRLSNNKVREIMLHKEIQVSARTTDRNTTGLKVETENHQQREAAPMQISDGATAKVPLG